MVQVFEQQLEFKVKVKKENNFDHAHKDIDTRDVVVSPFERYCASMLGVVHKGHAQLREM